MAIFTLRKQGEKTDITKSFIDGDKNLKEYFNGARLSYMDNLSEDATTLKDSLSFGIDLAMAVNRASQEMQIENEIIKKGTSAESIERADNNRAKLQEQVNKASKEYETRVLEYMPLSKGEESYLNDTKVADKRAKRLKAKLDKDYKKLLGMFTDEDTFSVLDKLKEDQGDLLSFEELYVSVVLAYNDTKAQAKK